MKNLKKYFLFSAISLAFVSCSSDDSSVASNVTLSFKNTFGDTEIVLGGETSTTATVNTSEEGQVHHFSELKYVISNIRLVKADGTEIPYNINDLDKGATVVNQANPSSLNYVMNNIPSGEYKQIKFGLGVRSDLNTLDQVRFPKFYALAGKNDTEMMWEWGTGYRFTKIEGFYDTDNKEMSVHTGSTLDGDKGDESSYVQGVDAYRNIVLDFPQNAVVRASSPKINIKADFNYLLSGEAHKIVLTKGKIEDNYKDNNATPNTHTAVKMLEFVDNIGGDGKIDQSGMFSIINLEN